MKKQCQSSTNKNPIKKWETSHAGKKATLIIHLLIIYFNAYFIKGKIDDIVAI